MHFVDAKPFVKDYRDQQLSAPTFYSFYGSKHVKLLVMPEPSIAFDRLPLMLMVPVLVHPVPVWFSSPVSGPQTGHPIISINRPSENTGAPTYIPYRQPGAARSVHSTLCTDMAEILNSSVVDCSMPWFSK